MLGLCFCVRALPSCGKRGPLFIAVRGPLTIAASRCRAQAPDAQAQQSWLTGPAPPRHVGSSQTRARTRVPCISRQTLNHCATREARVFDFNDTFDTISVTLRPFQNRTNGEKQQTGGVENLLFTTVILTTIQLLHVSWPDFVTTFLSIPAVQNLV